MKIVLFISLCVFVCHLIVHAQSIPADSLYLNQIPPGDTAKLFSPGIFVRSGYFASERISISADGKEIYYTERNGYSSMSKARIKCFKFYNNKWNGPFSLFDYYSSISHLSPNDYITSPGLSPDGNILYFHDSKHQSYYAVKNDKGWSEPSIFWNNSLFKHYLQLTDSGYYYLTSNPNGGMTDLGLCKIKINNADTLIQYLKLPLNSEKDVIDFYISRDESFLIFSAASKKDRTCFGYVDLFITYQKKDCTWTNPKNMGHLINAASLANWGPYVTADKKYLFFSRGTSDTTTHLYWVRLGNLIDSLKHNNFIPYVKLSIPKQSGKAGFPFNYKINDSTFIDDDGNSTLTFSAALSNGNHLPAWLSFNSGTRTFSGNPTESGTFNIKVTATDTEKETVSCTFTLKIVNNRNLINKK